MRGFHPQEPTVEPENNRPSRLAKPDGALCDRIEHWLDVRGRARNHAQDLCGRRLLLQRLAHLSMGLRERLVLSLQLREEPHVLYRDHGLVSEGLEELHLCIGESTRFLPS